MTAFTKCPGQDGRFWSPKDVSEKECPECGYEIEFMKFDLLRSCPECKVTVVNPKYNLSCARWCDHAKKCLGQMGSTYEGIQSLRETVEDELKKVFSQQPEKLKHVKKVTQTAERISRNEQVNLLTVVLSALLHEFKSEGNNLQDLKTAESGTPINNLQKLIKKMDLPGYIIEEILVNINQFPEGNPDQLSYRILKDAHFLSDKEPDILSKHKINRHISTESGKKLSTTLMRKHNTSSRK